MPALPDQRDLNLQGDIKILRDLYRQQQEIASDPVMAERRQLWASLASLQGSRPMILAETQGVLDELIPLSSLRCTSGWARSLERGLRDLIFRYQSVGDDAVVEPRIETPWQVTLGDYGVKTELHRGQNDGKLGSYTWEPPIKDLERDLDRLHFRAPRVDREGTLAWKNFLEESFGDILPVIIRGSYWWTTGLTWEAINLIGLQGLMLAMYDQPEGLHRLMAFLRDDFLHLLDWFEREGLLHVNNENDYIGSGSIGYTTELPGSDHQAGHPARVGEMWGLSESQETVGVSPAMFAEFIFPYQQPVIGLFGLSYYGCCEPVHTRIATIKQLPNLRRVSVSPWCDQEVMVRELGRNYIHCRKPKPTLISTERFDEELIRADIRQTLRIASDCPLEFAMKDVHTLNEQPWRLGRWVAIAREEIENFGV